MAYHLKKSAQPATFISLADVATSPNFSGMWFASRWNVLKGLIPASSQVSSTASSSQGDAMDFQKVGFWLATIDQVEDPQFIHGAGIGLIVCLLGEHSKTPKYPPGTPHISFAVMFETRRDWDLKQALPPIVSALSQGKTVAVHV